MAWSTVGTFVLGGRLLRIEVDVAEAVSYIEGFAGRLAHAGDTTEPLWNNMGRIARRSFAQNFAQGGRPSWHPLAPSTVMKKARAGMPARTAKGNIPRRLVQQGQFGPGNILIEGGQLRDSYVQKGAKGHVEDASDDGMNFFVGSGYVMDRELVPWKPLKAYHILRKKEAVKRQSGQSALVQIPLALIHEKGNKRLPARRNALIQDEDLAAYEREAVLWFSGSEGYAVH